MWLRHGEKTLLGLVKASVPYGNEKAPSIQVYRSLLSIRMNTLENGELASLFKSCANQEQQLPADPLSERMEVES